MRDKSAPKRIVARINIIFLPPVKRNFISLDYSSNSNSSQTYSALVYTKRFRRSSQDRAVALVLLARLFYRQKAY
jgi:hypothetical protein